MATVQLTHLHKAYPASGSTGAFTAVKDLNLEIAAGEFMVLVGPSGCGKSTTLRMIAGLEEITGGTIRIDGRVVNDVPPKDRDIAMVFQNYALYPHMTVFANMAFGLTLQKRPPAEIAARVREAAALLGLEPLLDRLPKALSGGQRQRVAVGRAIVRQPKVFLFDEPLSNLDAKMRIQMRAEISRLHDRLGATMIYVTHDQVEAMTMGDRICVMHDGELQQVAAPLTLYHQPANAYVAGFIGSPPMNLLSGTWQRHTEAGTFAAAGLTLPFPSALRGPATAGPILLGLRPEDIAAEPLPGHVPLVVRLELAEPMGAETHLHLRAGEQSLVARVRSEQLFHQTSELTMHLNLAKARFFDLTTGQALT
jgi:multiple sugar transport system ATP-binding protein